MLRSRLFPRSMTTRSTVTGLDSVRHRLNPLHVFCRLRDVHIPMPIALLAARVYERVYLTVL
jgi:hypothetical protein